MRTISLVLTFCLSACAAWLPAAPCYAVSSGQVEARDLAQAIPEFSRLPADLTFGYAPIPGVARVFSVAELQRIAKDHDIAASISGKVCFAWTLQPLEKEQVRTAMQTSLEGQRAVIEIVDQKNAQVPSGKVVFPLQGLTAISDKPAIWNGYIEYAPGRRFSTWVLVRVRVSEHHLVANRAIQPGEVIHLQDFQDREYEGPLLRDKIVTQITPESDFVASRSISAGTTLVTGMLARSPDIRSGDVVTVTVDSGAAHIEAPGLATQAGSAGDTVLVKNPKSGSFFKARVVGKGRVTVLPGILSGLVGQEDKS